MIWGVQGASLGDGAAPGFQASPSSAPNGFSSAVPGRFSDTSLPQFGWSYVTPELRSTSQPGLGMVDCTIPAYAPSPSASVLSPPMAPYPSAAVSSVHSTRD